LIAALRRYTNHDEYAVCCIRYAAREYAVMKRDFERVFAT
tara:strand:- start:155 stop:274 length:120 start_codon:yes stop_codon:yes gene_type:complete